VGYQANDIGTRKEGKGLDASAKFGGLRIFSNPIQRYKKKLIYANFGDGNLNKKTKNECALAYVRNFYYLCSRFSKIVND